MRRITSLFAGSIALAACASTAGVRPDEGAAAGGLIEKPKFRLADIENRDGDGLNRVLGAPDLVRVEGRGEFRRYTLATCALLITLYPEDTGVRRVRSVEAGALKSGEEKPDLDSCLAHGR